nr:MAG TPA: hypothetical protein [Caudoviricetes sp.]
MISYFLEKVKFLGKLFFFFYYRVIIPYFYRKVKHLNIILILRAIYLFINKYFAASP